MEKFFRGGMRIWNTGTIGINKRMEYLLDRANQSLDQINDRQIWYRPHIKSNAIGNIVLHIVGNLKQWILGGIADLPDTRNREEEFSANNMGTKNQMKHHEIDWIFSYKFYWRKRK